MARAINSRLTNLRIMPRILPRRPVPIPRNLVFVVCYYLNSRLLPPIQGRSTIRSCVERGEHRMGRRRTWADHARKRDCDTTCERGPATGFSYVGLGQAFAWLGFWILRLTSWRARRAQARLQPERSVPGSGSRPTAVRFRRFYPRSNLEGSIQLFELKRTSPRPMRSSTAGSTPIHIHELKRPLRPWPKSPVELSIPILHFEDPRVFH